MKKSLLGLIFTVLLSAIVFSSCSCNNSDYAIFSIKDRSDASIKDGYTYSYYSSLSNKDKDGVYQPAKDGTVEVNIYIKENWEVKYTGLEIEIYDDAVFNMSEAEIEAAGQQFNQLKDQRVLEEVAKEDGRTLFEINREVENELKVMEEYKKFFPLDIELIEGSERHYSFTIPSIQHDISFMIQGIQIKIPVVKLYPETQNGGVFEYAINDGEFNSSLTAVNTTLNYNDEYILKIKASDSNYEVPDKIYYYQDGTVTVFRNNESIDFANYKFNRFVYQDSSYSDGVTRLSKEETLYRMNCLESFKQEGEVKFFKFEQVTSNVHIALSEKSDHNFIKVYSATNSAFDYTNLNVSFSNEENVYAPYNFEIQNDVVFNILHSHYDLERGVLKLNDITYNYNFENVTLKFYDDNDNEINDINYTKLESNFTSTGGMQTRFNIVKPNQNFKVEVQGLRLYYTDSSEVKHYVMPNEIAGLYEVTNENEVNEIIAIYVTPQLQFNGINYAIQNLNILVFIDKEFFDTNVENELNLLTIKDIADQTASIVDFYTDSTNEHTYVISYNFLINSDVRVIYNFE